MSHTKRCYITTAIDYVNSLPHIGTAYEKIGTDVLARWYRLQGFDVRFQMGNDEHSTNVKKAADERGIDPKVYCDEMGVHFEGIWKSLNISYDNFIRTTDPHHEAGVQKLFATIMEKGDIYKSRYEGWYCESCEAFLMEKDLVEGLCPHHKAKPAWLSEENFFFALSTYRDRLIQHIEAHPEFILPEIRRNEIMSLLREGLQDISVSRSSVDWGVTLPNEPNHAVYVWFDALINYITAVGYGWDEASFTTWWPADMHVIGKDITRFHCVIWPAMLMSAGIPLPKTIFGHGFVYLKGERMSKTLGNVITPMDVVGEFGADPLRYYLLREGGFGRDADFTWDHFVERYNGDLANGIGNLVSRTIGMATKYLEGTIPPGSFRDTPELSAMTTALLERVTAALDHTTGEIQFHQALSHIWDLIAAADRHINEHKPWELAKAGNQALIAQVLWEVAVSIRLCALMLSPFLPETAVRIWRAMGMEAVEPFDRLSLAQAMDPWKKLAQPITVASGSGLFPRIERKEPEEASVPKKVKPHKEKPKMETPTGTELIDIHDFAKIQLRTAKVTAAEKVEGADKLLKLQVSLGSEERQIVAGIAKHYAPEELVGKDIVVVANLKPAKLRGIESQGMLLAASDENTVSILTPLKEVQVGSKVK